MDASDLIISAMIPCVVLKIDEMPCLSPISITWTALACRSAGLTPEFGVTTFDVWIRAESGPNTQRSVTFDWQDESGVSHWNSSLMLRFDDWGMCNTYLPIEVPVQELGRYRLNAFYNGTLLQTSSIVVRAAAPETSARVVIH